MRDWEAVVDTWRKKYQRHGLTVHALAHITGRSAADIWKEVKQSNRAIFVCTVICTGVVGGDGGYKNPVGVAAIEYALRAYPPKKGFKSRVRNAAARWYWSKRFTGFPPAVLSDLKRAAKLGRDV